MQYKYKKNWLVSLITLMFMLTIFISANVSSFTYHFENNESIFVFSHIELDDLDEVRINYAIPDVTLPQMPELSFITNHIAVLQLSEYIFQPPE